MLTILCLASQTHIMEHLCKVSAKITRFNVIGCLIGTGSLCLSSCINMSILSTMGKGDMTQEEKFEHVLRRSF